MEKKYFLLYLVLIIGTMACTKNNPTENQYPSAKIVIEGYIYANEPVRDFRISRINSSGSSDLIPINNAEVFITQGINQIPLLPVYADSGIYAQADSLTYLLNDSDTVQLHVQVDDNTCSATVIFPEKITGLEISTTQIYASSANSTDTVATLTWNPIPNSVGYAIIIRNITSKYGPMNPGEQIESVFEHPVQSTAVYFLRSDFPFSGDFEIYVSAITPAYAEMYDRSSNTVIETSNIIQNGWGIFTAFNGVSIPVSVY